MSTFKKITRIVDTNFWRGKTTSYTCELECGHVEYVKPRKAKGVSPRPVKAKCRECDRTDSATKVGGGT